MESCPNLLSGLSSAIFLYNGIYKRKVGPLLAQMGAGYLLLGCCNLLNVEPVNNIGKMILQGCVWSFPGVLVGILSDENRGRRQSGDRVICLLGGAFLTLKIFYTIQQTQLGDGRCGGLGYLIIRNLQI